MRLELDMIVLRVARGIRQHWHIRATEWVMIYPAFFLSFILLFQENMFQFQGYAVVRTWANQPQWAMALLLCVSVRLAALVVNGTFVSFRYSPHMRAAASWCGLLFWGIYCLGFLQAAWIGVASWAAPLAFSTFVLMEYLNIYRSLSDVFRNH